MSKFFKEPNACTTRVVHEMYKHVQAFRSLTSSDIQRLVATNIATLVWRSAEPASFNKDRTLTILSLQLNADVITALKQVESEFYQSDNICPPAIPLKFFNPLLDAVSADYNKEEVTFKKKGYTETIYDVINGNYKNNDIFSDENDIEEEREAHG